MKVKIKGFKVDMELGNEGITLDVYDTEKNFLGDLRIGRAKIEWCKGKTRKGNGVKVSWKELVAWFET